MASQETMTPKERVEALSPEQHQDILVKMIEALEANGRAAPMLDVMADWSLIDRGQPARDYVAGPGGHAGPALCPKHKVPMVYTITDDVICAVCEKAERKEAVRGQAKKEA